MCACGSHNFKKQRQHEILAGILGLLWDTLHKTYSKLVHRNVVGTQGVHPME
jgi:hypothetical protein